MDELMDYEQISELTGYAVQTLRQWRSRGEMPEPDRIIGISPVWNASTIRRWHKEKLKTTARSLSGPWQEPRPERQKPVAPPPLVVRPKQ